MATGSAQMGHRSLVSYQNLSSPTLPEGTHKVRAVAGPNVVHSEVHNLVLQNVHINLLLFCLPTEVVLSSNVAKDGIALGELVGPVN